MENNILPTVSSNTHPQSFFTTLNHISTTGRRDIEIPPRILRSSIIDICKTVHDPEIPVNIYDLGLIYEVTVNEEGEAHILMTLTSPMCPVADILPEEVRAKAELVEGVSVATVELTFEPQWSMETHLSPAARLELNL